MKTHLYTQAWIDFLSGRLATEKGFRKATGTQPTPRPQPAPE